ncbi:hypothetical protein C0991_005741 [Blastosporella zonata]|nr:hypothetical protein C0991_005741 [Blastosporella zonata]
MGSKDNALKRRQFLNCLHSGGAAEIWYNALPDATKADWSLVEDAFHAKWPPVKIAAKCMEEYEEELLSCRMKDEALGLKEQVADREVWSHIAWANKMGKLASGASIMNSKTYIGHVKKALLYIIRDKLADSYTDWTSFLNCMCNIDIDYIKGKADNARILLDTITQRMQHFDLFTPTIATSPSRRLANITNKSTVPGNNPYGGVCPPVNGAPSNNAYSGGHPPISSNTRGPGRVISTTNQLAF